MDQVNVSFSLPMQSYVELELLTLTGQLISKERFRVDQVPQSVALDVSQLENGVYLIRADSGGQKEVRKIVIAR